MPLPPPLGPSFSFHTIITHQPPSTPPSSAHLVRSHRLMPYLMRLLISCHPSIHPKKKKKKSIFKKVVKKHGWCPWMFQLWRLCVVFLCCCRRRVAVACTVCRRMYLLVPSFLPSFSCRRLWCGADGDRNFLFFFFTNCYTSTGHNQNCYRKSMSCAS
jgi:hypothetical protein